MQYFPTSQVVTVEDWPYGFRLKCNMRLSIEFDKRKGFRSVTQSDNPKNGGWNKPKKSTYSPVMVWSLNDEGKHVVYGFSFYKIKDLASQCKWLHENRELFTEEQIGWFFGEIVTFLQATARSYVIYCGSKLDDVTPLIQVAVNAALLGYRSWDAGKFLEIVVDVDALETSKVPDFQPFAVTSYGV